MEQKSTQRQWGDPIPAGSSSLFRFQPSSSQTSQTYQTPHAVCKLKLANGIVMVRLMIARHWWRVLLIVLLVVSCIKTLQDEAELPELGRRLAELETVMFSYHKDFFPLGLGDVLCFFVAGSSLVVAAGGGIGGGGILVSLYMLFLNFRPRHAVALSNFTILGGALANTLVNLLRRDENGQSMIDWNIIVMMEPATIAGTIVGSFLSKYLADFVLMAFLILVLAMLSFRTLDKGLEMFNYETAQGPQALPQEEEDHDATDEEDAKESRNLVGGSVRRVQRSPSTKVSLLVCCFLGCVVLTILKGSGRGSIVGVTCGSLSFWLLTWATLPWVLGFGMIFRDILINEHLENEEDGHDYHSEEIRWNAVNTIRYPLLCSLAGVLAGLFGVGGGIIKGPLMLELGVEPQVAGATASTMRGSPAPSNDDEYVDPQQTNLALNGVDNLPPSSAFTSALLLAIFRLHLRPPPRQLQIPVGTAGPHLPAPDCSGHCRTSSATARLQWATPDFIRELQSPVGTAGLQSRAPDPSGHCRTSIATARSQWALPDFIRERQIPVGTAGLQPQAPDPSGHCRTSTCIHARKNAR
eukprot:s6_g54.t2